MNEQRNLILAVGLSVAILFGFHYFFERPKAELQQTSAQPQITAPQKSVEHIEDLRPREEVIKKDQRIQINSSKVKGSIRLKGMIIDDLMLSDYKETTDPNSPGITLLNPLESKDSYICTFSWHTDQTMDLPSDNTLWQLVDQRQNELSVNSPIKVYWVNAQGFRFEREIILDDNYMFTVKDKVINNSNQPLTLQAKADIKRYGLPQTGGFMILHEGPLGVLNHKLQEVSYKDLQQKGRILDQTKGGWLGITDKYWLVSLIPAQDQTVQTWFESQKVGPIDLFQTGYSTPSFQIAPQGEHTVTHNLFAGAKKLRLLDAYEAKLGFDKFDLAVDFGWFYFITKPLFYVLEWLHQLLGNFGLGILLLTVGIKTLFFPLANKSYRSMSRMKHMQPKIEALKLKFGEDKMRMNQELMNLYKTEKINPLAGCLPMLIQAPVFFCLYKVLFVTLEMRHAPFYGWISDLSAPDHTSLFNLFGLLAFTPPSFLMIGAWPILMGLTMWLQQKMSPQPADPTQAKMMMIMPFFMTFLLAQFPAGLVIYWAWNNILSMAQQWAIGQMEEKRTVALEKKKGTPRADKAK